MPLAPRSWIRRAAVATAAVLIAALCAAVAQATSQGTTAPVMPGPHNGAKAAADGKAAGAQQSNLSSAVAASSAATKGKGPRAATAQAAAPAPGSGARVGGFGTCHGYAT